MVKLVTEEEGEGGGEGLVKTATQFFIGRLSSPFYKIDEAYDAWQYHELKSFQN